MSNDSLHGPHLQAAFICEKFLQEKDGVLSFIRVVDRFFTSGTAAKMQQPVPIQGFVVVAFKAGTIGAGKYTLTVRLNKDGNQLAEIESALFFEGGEDHGVTNISPLLFLASEEGLYWLDVTFEEKLVTRIPLRILYQRVQMVPGQSPER